MNIIVIIRTTIFPVLILKKLNLELFSDYCLKIKDIYQIIYDDH